MTDPTITIAGLEARINSLRSAVQHSNRTAAERMTMFVEASSNADRLTAERDALAAQLSEVRATVDRQASMQAELDRVSADRVRIDCERADAVSELARTCRDLASERAHLAACQTRIAGLEQAANERSAEVARLTARVAELEARPVLTAERLTSAVYLSRGIPMDIAAEAAKAILAVLGPVTLPAQDAAERMAAAYCDAQREIGGKEWLGWSRVASGSSEVRDLIVESMRRAIASLSPVTLPPAQDRAEALARELYYVCGLANTSLTAVVALDCGTNGEKHLADKIRAALTRLGAPPTSPTGAPPEVFAGVSVEELAAAAHNAECDHMSEDRPGDVWPFIVRAVLARLEVSLVAPVDPEQIAADITRPLGDAIRTGEWKRIKEAARATLTAAGIPVTPEVGK